jgi:hypothetical protein
MALILGIASPALTKRIWRPLESNWGTGGGYNGRFLVGKVILLISLCRTRKNGIDNGGTRIRDPKDSFPRNLSIQPILWEGAVPASITSGGARRSQESLDSRDILAISHGLLWTKSPDRPS